MGFTLLVAVVSPVFAGPPTDQLKTQIDRVLGVLHDPALKGAAHRTERQAVVRDAMDVTIDFSEVSRRALGAAWEIRTPAERQDFVSVFTDFLKRSYLGRIDLYDDEKLLYDGDRIDGDVAVVSARVQWKDGEETSLGFKMLRGPDDQWRLYDVLMGGVSLVDNYRAQFTTVLRRGSYADMIKRIRTQGARQKE